MGLRIISKSIAILSILLLYSNNIEAQVYLRTQQDVDDFSGTTVLNSSLNIVGDSLQVIHERITDLTPLLSLQNINGSLSISNTYLASLNGLDNIINLQPLNSSSLYIGNNKLLTDISALSGVNCNRTIINNNPKLSFNNLDLINSNSIEISQLDLLQSLYRNKNAFCSKYVIEECANLENIHIEFNNDSLFNLEIKNNASLKKVSLSFDSTANKTPANFNEFSSLKSIIIVELNLLLDTIEVNNKYSPYMQFRLQFNPLLNGLCLFEKSIKLNYKYSKAYYDSLIGPHYWDLIKGSFINGNKYPFDTYDNALAADCSQYTTIKEQSLTDEDVSNFSIYPNPYTGGALQLSGVKVGTAIAVYDIVGKEVYRTQYNGGALGIPKLNTGIYMLESTQVNGQRNLAKLLVE